MDCQEIKKIIPRYFQHIAVEEEVKSVEEHLCVCHECRLTLGKLMDKVDEDSEALEQGEGKENILIIPETTSPLPEFENNSPEEELLIINTAEDKLKLIPESEESELAIEKEETTPNQEIIETLPETKEAAELDLEKKEQLPPENEDSDLAKIPTLKKNNKLGKLEYVSLVIGVSILGFIAYLFLKG
ncbi:MAG: hypothetical protein ABIH08_03555 [Candidatus Omnitrophota bacterium]